MKLNKKRCFWLNQKNLDYVNYHDNEWGHPIFSDELHFENLTLEGAQAGLSWETVLKKRNNYRQFFYNFEIEKVSKMNSSRLEKILLDPGIIRNRLKIFSVVNNAKCMMTIQKEFGSFNDYIWQFSDNKIIYANSKKSFEDTNIFKQNLSKTISKDLKKRGFKFVGETIIYSYLQASGIFQGHTKECFLFNKKL